jgi:hypothetical protein
MRSDTGVLHRTAIARTQIDNWPIAQSGLNARVVHCLDQAGVRTVGELRQWTDRQLLELRSLGTSSVRDVRRFFQLTEQLESGRGHAAHLRALLRSFLNRQEQFVLEQRYGLCDPHFRPNRTRCTLQQIAAKCDNITRERVRQIEEVALAKLRSKLCHAVAQPQFSHWISRIQQRGCVITSEELVDCVGEPRLGGYYPWGALLLMTELTERINFRYDYFSTLPLPVFNQVEKQILQLLGGAVEPVPFEKVLATVSDELSFLNGLRPRLVTVLLDHHPEISGTVDRRYFLSAAGAAGVVADILRSQRQPLHFHELTRLYNQRMQPHSRRGTGFILHVLGLIPEARRVSRAVYGLNR